MFLGVLVATPAMLQCLINCHIVVIIIITIINATVHEYKNKMQQLTYC